MPFILIFVSDFGLFLAVLVVTPSLVLQGGYVAVLVGPCDAKNQTIDREGLANVRQVLLFTLHSNTSESGIDIRLYGWSNISLVFALELLNLNLEKTV